MDQDQADRIEQGLIELLARQIWTDRGSPWYRASPSEKARCRALAVEIMQGNQAAVD